MSCPYFNICPFGAEAKKNGGHFDGVWRMFYCERDPNYQKCARFGRYKDGLHVPENLFPNARPGLHQAKAKLPKEIDDPVRVT